MQIVLNAERLAATLLQSKQIKEAHKKLEHSIVYVLVKILESEIT